LEALDRFHRLIGRRAVMSEVHFDASARWVIHPKGAVIVAHTAGEPLAEHQARAIVEAVGVVDRLVTPTGIITTGDRARPAARGLAGR
jgi:hypothetical protein